MNKSSIAVLPDCLRPIVPDSIERIGSKYDGGYVLPTGAIGRCDALITFGVNLDWSFETDVLSRYPHIQIYSFDKTTHLRYVLYWSITRTLYAPISWKKRHWTAWMKPFSYLGFVLQRRVHHTPSFIGPTDGEGIVGVDRVFSRFERNSKLFVKVDIEGAEYSIIDQLLQYKHMIEGFVFEFHEVETRVRFESAIHELMKDYRISHIHVNNVGGVAEGQVPSMLEVTFTRHDLVTGREFEGEHFVTELDTPNDPELPHLEIVFQNEPASVTAS